jgi:hypothetical protein
LERRRQLRERKRNEGMNMKTYTHNTRRQAVQAARKYFEKDAKKFIAGQKSKFTIKVGMTKK